MTSIPIYLISKDSVLESTRAIGGEALVQWCASHQFDSKEGASHLLFAGEGGSIAGVLLKVSLPLDIWSGAKVASSLPQGRYRFDLSQLDVSALDVEDVQAQLSLGWALDQYRYTRYKTKRQPILPFLEMDEMTAARISPFVEASTLARDLINTPASDLGTVELAAAAVALANRFGAEHHVVDGVRLEKEYPAIHTVGKGSPRRPCLIDLRWGDVQHPRLTLVGKGVCFDSGGLNIKTGSYMMLMKKDMGGAAIVLGLAHLIMTHRLPVCLRVLIPAVENSVDGEAYRPSDIITMRSGLTVEVGDTDAEGRLVVADALSDACDENPDLLIDCTTLTGAARIAVGTELPALFTNQDALAQELMAIGRQVQDPVWQLPLFDLYADGLKSTIADTSSTGTGSYGGAITAALFLKKFVKKDVPWVHLDMMAWNLKARAGRPEGGEAQAMRALFVWLEERYGAKA
jgi:leucyl aminopeptidase